MANNETMGSAIRRVVLEGFAVVLALWLVGSLVLAFPLKKTPLDKIGLRYGGGLFEGAHFEGVVEPGHGLFVNGWGDHLYLYPVTQRNYIISTRNGEGDVAGEDFVEAPSHDRIAVKFEVATYFKLNLDKLREFHVQIGQKYHAWTDDGWKRMLNDSFRQQIESALQREARQFDVADIYSNGQTLRDIQTQVGSVLKDNVARVLGDEYFCGPTYLPGHGCPDFTFVIKKVSVPAGVAQAFEDNRTSEIEVLTKQNEIKQRKAEASAIAELNRALDRSGPQYVQLKYIEALRDAIDKGLIQFWVLNGQNITVPGLQQPAAPKK